MENIKIQVQCKTHPKEVIHRVNIASDGKPELLCIECLIDQYSEDKSNIKLIEDVIKQVGSKEGDDEDKKIDYQKFDELSQKKKEHLAQFQEHMDTKKKAFEEEIEKVRVRLNTFLDEEKARFFALADAESATLVKNYEAIERRVSIGGLSEEKIVDKAKELTDYSEFLTFVQGLKEGLKNGNETDAIILEQAEKAINEAIRNPPDVELNSEALQDSLKAIENSIQLNFDNELKIVNKVTDGSYVHPITFDSSKVYYFRTVHRNEHFYIAGINPEGRDDIKYTFTWTPRLIYGDKQAKFELVPAKGLNNFYIYLPFYGEYIFPSDEYFDGRSDNLTRTKRNVFSKQNASEDCIWTFERYGNYYRIKSAKYGGYMYTCGYGRDHDRRWVFVWNDPSDVGPEGTWELQMD